jgi:hypothetical protein
MLVCPILLYIGPDEEPEIHKYIDLSDILENYLIEEQTRIKKEHEMDI